MVTPISAIKKRYSRPRLPQKSFRGPVTPFSIYSNITVLFYVTTSTFVKTSKFEMADLDDFFAKKDRKKSKSVKKFATADELAKKLEDSKQKLDVRPKKDRPQQEGEESGRGAEEEWKDYEEPVKDYTGLKIQVLQGGTGAPDTGRDSSAEDSAPENSKIKGPWNKPQVEVEPTPAPPPREEKERAAPAAYVPPQSRNRAEPVRRSQAVRKNAPDIHNDDYFPVLGAAKRAGWSPAPPARPARAPLALGNRFTSLQDS